MYITLILYKCHFTIIPNPFGGFDNTNAIIELKCQIIHDIRCPVLVSYRYTINYSL